MKKTHILIVISLILILSIGSMLSSYAESSSQNYQEMTEQILLSRTYKGILNGNVDKVFCFNIQSEGDVSINLSFQGNEKQGVFAYLYGDEMNYLMDIDISTGKDICSLDAGKYYIILHTNKIFSYKLQVTFEEKKINGPMNFVADKRTSNSITLTWDKVPGATGYQITCSTDYNKLQTIDCDQDTRNYTFKELKALKHYIFSIEAYFEGGKTSEIKKLDSYTLGKTGIYNLYWYGKNHGIKYKDCYRIGFYEISDSDIIYAKKINIQYSLYKSMKKPKNSYIKIDNIGSSSIYYDYSIVTSKKMKKLYIKTNGNYNLKYIKLKHRKKYYIRVRLLNIVGGKNCYSEWSNIKSIKIR